MPVPGTQEIRRLLLEAFRAENPQIFRINEYMKLTAEYFGQNIDTMSAHERNELKENINEALAYLSMKHLISNPSKQAYMITKKGKKILDETTGIIDDEEKPVSVQQVIPSPEEASSESEAVSEPAALSDVEEQAQDSDSLPDVEDEPQDSDSLPDVEDEPQDSDSLPDVEEQTKDFDALPDVEEQTQDSDSLPDVEEQTQDSDSLPDVEEQTQDSDSLPDEEPQTEELNADLEPEEAHTLNDDETLPPSDTDTQDYIDEVEPDMPTDEITEDYSIQPLSVDDVLDRHNSELADQVLMRAASLPSDKFPMFVADLLSKMGYNVFQNARYTSDASGNSLIHGVIIDPKAKTQIYIHAEKLSPGRTVGKSDMRDFADELAEMGCTGLFATTGDFSEQAEICAQDERIMLIDGHKLANIMINHNFCVNVVKVFELKELDEESFSDYEN